MDPRALQLSAIAFGMALASCMGGTGVLQPKIPSRVPPIRILLVEGPADGDATPTLRAALVSFFLQPQFRIRIPAAAELRALPPVTSLEGACAVGRTLNEELVVWTSTSQVRSDRNGLCGEEPESGAARASSECDPASKAASSTASLTMTVRVVNAVECQELTVLDVHGSLASRTAEEAARGAETLAARELKEKLRPFFPLQTTVVRPDGEQALIAPAREAGVEEGAIYDVLKGDVPKGTVVITEAWRDAGTARILSGINELHEGDVLVESGYSCCLEVRPVLSVLRAAFWYEAPALGGGLQAEWYRPRSSPLLAVSFERVSSSKDAVTDLAHAHLGYIWKLQPRSFGVYVRIVGGFNVSRVNLPGTTPGGEDRAATGVGLQVGGSIGAKLSFGDIAWLDVETGYLKGRKDMTWTIDGGASAIVPPTLDVDISGPLIRTGIAFRLWPF